MKKKIICVFACMLFALTSWLLQAAPPTNGQFAFQQKPNGNGGLLQWGVTPVANQAFGWDGSQVVMYPVDSTNGYTNARLIEMVAGVSYQLPTATYDSDGVITTAPVKWPDGTSGTFTRTAKDNTWLAVNAYTITYSGTPTKTITQSTVTRDPTFGVVTVAPALTVSP